MVCPGQRTLLLVLLGTRDHAYTARSHFSLGIEAARQGQCKEELEEARGKVQNRLDLT